MKCYCNNCVRLRAKTNKKLSKAGNLLSLILFQISGVITLSTFIKSTLDPINMLSPLVGICGMTSLIIGVHFFILEVSKK